MAKITKTKVQTLSYVIRAEEIDLAKLALALRHLRDNGWHRRRAADAAGCSLRNMYYYIDKLEALGIDIKESTGNRLTEEEIKVRDREYAKMKKRHWHKEKRRRDIKKVRQREVEELMGLV